MAQAYIVQPMGSRRKSIRGAVIELDQSSWTYDGEEHCPKVTKVTLGGKELTEWQDYVCVRQAASQAGQYEVLMLGVLEYGGAVSAPWKIEKAVNIVTASSSDVTITGPAGTSECVTLSFAGDGVVTVSESTYVTSQVDGHTLTLTGMLEGEDTLTVTVDEGTNYFSARCELRVKVQFVDTVFENNSWDMIASACAAGNAKDYWQLGDEKSFTHNGETYHFQIGGFDHDDLDSSDARYDDPTYNGGTNKAAITLIMKEVFANERMMNDNRTDSCNWGGSKMRTTTIPQIKSEMDQDLISVVRKVTKKTGKNADPYTTLSTTDDLFLMSEIEAIGKSSQGGIDEGSYYEFFQSGNNCVKYKNGSASAKYYWLRSPSGRVKGFFLDVTSGGTCTSQGADCISGVVLCCCI